MYTMKQSNQKSKHCAQKVWRNLVVWISDFSTQWSCHVEFLFKLFDKSEYTRYLLSKNYEAVRVRVTSPVFILWNRKQFWLLSKVRIFWEGHKILWILHLTFSHTKIRWKFHKILWPSENIRTLKAHYSEIGSFLGRN